MNNTGNANLTFTAIGVTGPYAISPTGTTCSTSSPVAALENCTVAITFTPTAAGAASGSVSFTDNAPGSPQTVNWTATGLNPVPGITSLSPASATAGAASQTLTINGTNFVSTSTVTYNGAPHSASFVSATQLTITLSTSDQSTAGTCAVVVTNPAPGGGASSPVNFTVNNPVPGITSLSPASATAGAASQTLTINGSNFVSTSTVTYNGAPHSASFVSATQLTITLSTSDQATAGTCAVVVTNPAPGGGASSPVNFMVLGPVVSLSPSSLTFASQLSSTTSTAQPVSLTNTGNDALSITSIAASGDFAETNACGTSLAAGNNCTINVTFKPTTGSARSGTLSVTDNAPGGVQTLPLAGTGEDFSLTLPSGSSTTSTVSPGQTANYSLSLGGLGGMTQTINFVCTGAPSAATCSVNPTSAAPGASGSVSLTVTVSTTAPSAAVVRLRRPQPGPGSGITLLLSGLLAMAGLATITRRPQIRLRRCALAWCGMALFALATASCGGGGARGGGVITKPATPAGTYTLTVTGTAAGAANLTHSMTLTLTVN